MKIEINGRAFTLAFTYGVFRALSKKWNLPGVQAVFNQFTDADGREIDVFVDLVHAAIQYSGETITEDEVGDWMLQNFDKITDISKALMEALPQAEPDAGKQIPREKGEVIPN
jgi:hypothetical protein